jgi:hypothetical protein
MVIEQFNDVGAVQLAATDAVFVVRLTRHDGSDVTAAWARTDAGAQVALGATGEGAMLYDQYGLAMPAAPHEGVYSLALAGAVCSRRDGCPVGGHVVLVVQPSGGPVYLVVNGVRQELRFQ